MLYLYLQRLQQLLISSNRGTRFYNLVPRSRSKGSGNEDDVYIPNAESRSVHVQAHFPRKYAAAFQLGSEGFVVHIRKEIRVGTFDFCVSNV
jgi:hypothetical protein